MKVDKNSLKRNPKKKKRFFAYFYDAFEAYFKTSKLSEDIRELDKEVDAFIKKTEIEDGILQKQHDKTMNILDLVHEKLKQVNSLPDHSIKRAELLKEIDNLLDPKNHP